MIIDAILGAGGAVILLIVNLLPELPSMPTAITEPTTSFLSVVGKGLGFVQYLYGAELFIALIVVAVAIMQFERIYHFVLFIVKKIPILNIK